jgi:hypothetical protein
MGLEEMKEEKERLPRPLSDPPQPALHGNAAGALENAQRYPVPGRNAVLVEVETGGDARLTAQDVSRDSRGGGVPLLFEIAGESGISVPIEAVTEKRTESDRNRSRCGVATRE